MRRYALLKSHLFRGRSYTGPFSSRKEAVLWPLKEIIPLWLDELFFDSISVNAIVLWDKVPRDDEKSFLQRQGNPVTLPYALRKYFFPFLSMRKGCRFGFFFATRW